jgi:hypothetical protein
MSLASVKKMPRLDSTIGRIGDFKTLEHVQIGIHISSRVHLELTLEWSTAFFGYLQRLPNLKWLYFSDRCIPLSSAIVSSLVSHCPRLKTWERSPNYPCTNRAIITLQAFLDMLSCGPNIVNLPVIVDTSVLPSKAARAQFGSHVYGPELLIKVTTVTPEVEEIILEHLPLVLSVSACNTETGNQQTILKRDGSNTPPKLVPSKF